MNIIRLQSYHLKQWTRKIKTSTWSIVYLVCVFVCSLQRQSNNVQFLLRTMFFLFCPIAINGDIDEFVQADFYKVDFIIIVAFFSLYYFVYRSLSLSLSVYVPRLLFFAPITTHALLSKWMRKNVVANGNWLLDDKNQTNNISYDCRKQLVSAVQFVCECHVVDAMYHFKSIHYIIRTWKQVKSIHLTAIFFRLSRFASLYRCVIPMLSFALLSL